MIEKECECKRVKYAEGGARGRDDNDGLVAHLFKSVF